MQHMGDGNNNKVNNQAVAGPSDSGQSAGSGGPQNPQITQNKMSQSIKSNSSKGKKSQQQKDREKNIKEIKMYYWTKVDQGDRTEVVKILTFAK